MEQANWELMERELRRLGLNPSEESLRALVRHLELVSEWNQRVNLTAITDERQMVIKHVLDSAVTLEAAKMSLGARVLDVGTGAGFPGVTMKCLMPSVRLVLIESLAKRCRFLQVVEEELAPVMGWGSNGIQVEWGRAEDYGHKEGYRATFDVVTARAVAELRVLAELCLPFCRPGGLFLAMKGPDVEEEVEAAQRALEVLGGKVEGVTSVELPEGAGTRTLISIRKVGGTLSKYPRRAGIPGRKPL